jgi:hypothetical protein
MPIIWLKKECVAPRTGSIYKPFPSEPGYKDEAKEKLKIINIKKARLR